MGESPQYPAIHPVPDISQLETVLWYLGLPIMAAILWRLYALGLIGRYPALFWCLGVQLARGAGLTLLKVNTTAYAVTYIVSLPVVLVAYVCVALEIYSHAVESYRGLFIVGRRVMLGVFAGSAAIAILIHLGELRAPGEQFQTLRAVLLVESAVCLMLLMFLVAIAIFLVWYPANVRKNVLLYSFSFSFYMGAQCATLFLRNSDPTTMVRIASMVRLLLDNLSLVALAVFLQSAWESERRPSAAGLSAEQRQRLLSQLNHLNATLERGAKPPHSAR